MFETKELEINMGPQHPSTHGVLRVILKLDGETVVGADCDIGYLHRGVEKLAEHSEYDRKSTRLNSSHSRASRMPSSA